MSETMTIRELRDLLNGMPALDGDYTNVEEVRIRCEFQRIHLITPLDSHALSEENRALITANSQLRKNIEANKKEFDTLKHRLGAIRHQIRTRKPNLP
jgi:hypothetical protein